MKAYDLTHTLWEEIPVFPGDASPRITAGASLAANGYRASHLELDSHNGTHMDAPAHLLADGKFLDELAPECFGGMAWVWNASTEGGLLTLSCVQRANIPAGVDFVLLSTGWEEKWGDKGYATGYPLLTPEAAAYLAGLGLKGIGVDALSVDAIDSLEQPNHRTFLSRGMLILENLTGLIPLRGRCLFLTASPLKFRDAEGAPARVFAWEGFALVKDR